MTAPQRASRRERSKSDVTTEVIETIATAEGVSPGDLDACLYDVVDPEALNTLFQQEDDGPATNGCISFGFHGYTVTVDSDRTVGISEVLDE